MNADNPKALFSEAARSWLDLRDSGSSRARYLRPRTIKTYRLEIQTLILFFGKMRLCDVTNEDIRKYQRKRSDGHPPFKHQRSPAHVNDEIAKLRIILTRANLWHPLADGYEELAIPLEQPRRVMTKQEEAHLFDIAASRPDFAFIYAYALLSTSTSASGAELRGLRMIDVDLIGRTLQINSESAKNSVRVRTIPLVDDAVWALNSLVARARSLGCTEPHHFLFPYKRGSSPHDPTRQMADNGHQERWWALICCILLAMVDLTPTGRLVLRALTSRERKILVLTCAGYPYKKIAERIGTSEPVVKNQMSAILRKTHTRSCRELVVFIFRHGVVECPCKHRSQLATTASRQV